MVRDLAKPDFVVHGVSGKAWADRWGIEPFVVACYVCRREKETTIPFARGSLRGLKAPACPCGDLSKTYCVVRAPNNGPLLGWDA